MIDFGNCEYRALRLAMRTCLHDEHDPLATLQHSETFLILRFPTIGKRIRNQDSCVDDSIEILFSLPFVVKDAIGSGVNGEFA